MWERKMQENRLKQKSRIVVTCLGITPRRVSFVLVVTVRVLCLFLDSYSCTQVVLVDQF